MVTAGFRLDWFFIKKLAPARAPVFKLPREDGFVGVSQSFHQSEQFLSGRQIWLLGGVANDDLFLMKMAHLHRNIAKKPRDGHSAIAHESGENKTGLFQFSARLLVIASGLGKDFPTIYILMSIGITNNQKPAIAGSIVF